MCNILLKLQCNFCYKPILFFSYFIFIYLIPSFAQPLTSDSTLLQKSIDNVQESYNKKISGNLLIYNGNEYHQDKYATIGYPFFLSDTPMLGAVMYKNVWYKNMQLQFDITNNSLIIKDEYQNNGLVVQSNFVPYFIIANHRFEYITPSNDDIVTTGYYERITGSTTALFVKRTKKFKQALKAEDNTTKFVLTNEYFLVTNNKFYSIDNKKSLMNFLADKKELLQKYIEENNVSFKNDIESAFEKTISYYNQLN